MEKKLFSILHLILGREIDMNKYEDRLTLQKLTCILQKAGMDFGYRFTWYVRGPYSPSLASDAYTFYRSGTHATHTILPSEEKLVRTLKSAFSDDIVDSNKLEIIASLLYLRDERGIKITDPSLVQLLESLKPWFTKQEIEHVRNKIATCKLFTFT